jgi:hypothetical protein
MDSSWELLCKEEIRSTKSKICQFLNVQCLASTNASNKTKECSITDELDSYESLVREAGKYESHMLFIKKLILSYR